MFKKKYIFVALILAFSSMCTTSCRHAVQPDSTEISMENTESEAIIEMTKDQKEFLINNSVNEEAVKEGRLKDWQIKLLAKYDYCMDYLKHKYTTHTFEITTYDASNSSFTKFIVVPDSDEDKVFTVNVFEDGNDFSATDTYE